MQHIILKFREVIYLNAALCTIQRIMNQSKISKRQTFFNSSIFVPAQAALERYNNLAFIHKAESVLEVHRNGKYDRYEVNPPFSFLVVTTPNLSSQKCWAYAR